MAKYLRIKYVKSSIGNLQRHKDTIKSLGFRKLGQTVEIVDSPSARGMIQAVIHLVKFEEVEKDEASNGAPSQGGNS